MVDSKYPIQLDTDVELEKVDDNITEIGGSAINSLRSAIFNIEETLGINPQGIASDVTTRLNRALNPDGSIKASALAAIALVTLPIVNSMIASNAGIEESKLDLDYGTAWLKAQHDSNYALIISTMDALAIDIGHLTAHTSHSSTYGRHRTSDIDGYSGTSYDGYNLQGIVNDLNTRIINHLADPVAAHVASAISFDDTGLPIFANNVQDAIEETARYIEGATILHQDRQHSNGILQEQDVTYNETSHSYTIVPSSVLYGVSAGSTFIRYITLPTNFGLITRGDRVDILVGGTTTCTRYVDSTDPSSAVIRFLVPLQVGGTASAIVYKKPDEFSAPSSLNFAIRKTNISSIGGSIIQVIHPGSPYVLSSNIMPRNLSTSNKNIKLTWANGYTSDIDVYTLLNTFSSLSSTWTVENLSLVLNEQFANDHYPFISFVYNGELGIAFDEPDGYMIINSPASDSAWTVLGFSTGDVGYALNRRFYIDGYEFTGLKKLVDATGTVAGGGTKTIESISQNILANGIQVPELLRIKNTVTEDGTYVCDQINNSTSLNIESNLTPITSLNIVGYADTFGVKSISNQTLFELFVEGSDLSDARFFGSSRLEYYKEPVISSQDASQFFNVVDISRNFPASSVRLAYTIVSGTYIVQLGYRGSGSTVINGGEIVILPIPSIPGHRFKVYTINGTDYIEFEVIQNYITLSSDNAIDIDVYARQSEERYLHIGKVLHNKQYFKYLEDRRLFGNVGRYDVRTDYTRDYITYPRSLVRSGGVIRDCSLTYTIGATNCLYNGGQLLVNGMIIDTSKISFLIPNDGLATYNLYAESNGLIKLLKDNQYVTGKISTFSSTEILKSQDKTLLYVISVNSNSQISNVFDVRKFINNLDNKIELIIEDQEYVEGKTLLYGTFHDLQSAVNYINILQTTSSSVPQIIKIRGNVYLDSAVFLPFGTLLVGDGRFGNAKIVLTSSSAYISCTSGCTIRDINFYTALFPLNGFISSSIGSNILIENCTFSADTYNSNSIGIKFMSVSDVNIKNCFFYNMSIAIFGDISVTTTNNENYYISNNLFNDIRQNILYLSGIITNTKNIYFSNNIINNTCLDSANLINIGQVNGLYISGNIFNCTATTVASGAAINITGVSRNINILDNVIINTPASNEGLKYGILLNGTDLLYNSISLSTILNNKIYYFFGGSSIGVSLTKVSCSIISTNEIVCCRTSVNIDTSFELIITNNFLTSGWLLDLISAEAPVLKIDGTSPFDGNIIISKNVFLHWLVQNAGLPTPNSLVEITSSGGYGQNFINDNFFIVRTTNLNNIGSYPMLSNAAYSCTISNNIFSASSTLTSGISYITSIINSTGDNCLVTNNNLIDTSSSVFRNNITGTNSVDYMNKGGTYTAVIPMTNANISYTATHSGSYWFAGLLPSYMSGIYVADFYEFGGIEYTQRDVPIGSIIENVQVYIFFNGIVTGDVSFILRKTYWNSPSSGINVSNTVTPIISGSSGYLTVTLYPTITTNINNNEIHSVMFNTKSSSISGIFIIYGALVTYIL